MSRFPIICVVLLSASSALAQSTTTGAISGRVTDAGSKEPMVGVTVVIQSETGGDPQTTFTDADGGYKITELIPGTYSVSFIDDTATVKKTGIRVGANDVVPVYQAIKRGDVIVLEGKAPMLKLSKTDLSLKIDRE